MHMIHCKGCNEFDLKHGMQFIHEQVNSYCSLSQSCNFYWGFKGVKRVNGPSVVRALPLTAGTNEGGPYFRYFFPLFLVVTMKKKKLGDPPTPL